MCLVQLGIRCKELLGITAVSLVSSLTSRTSAKLGAALEKSEEDDMHADVCMGVATKEIHRSKTYKTKPRISQNHK